MERLTKDDKSFIAHLLGAVMIQVGAAGLLLLALGSTGCMVAAGTPEGWKEYGNHNTGLIAEGKTPAGKRSAYYRHRDLEVTEQTKRETAMGWMSRLVGGASPVEEVAHD